MSDVDSAEAQRLQRAAWGELENVARLSVAKEAFLVLRILPAEDVPPGVQRGSLRSQPPALERPARLPEAAADRCSFTFEVKAR